MRWLREWCGQKNDLSSEFGGGETSEGDWEGAPSKAEWNQERCYGNHAEVVPREREWPTVSRVAGGTDKATHGAKGGRKNLLHRYAVLGGKKNNNIAQDLHLSEPS